MRTNGAASSIPTGRRRTDARAQGDRVDPSRPQPWGIVVDE